MISMMMAIMVIIYLLIGATLSWFEHEKIDKVMSDTLAAVPIEHRKFVKTICTIYAIVSRPIFGLMKLIAFLQSKNKSSKN